MFEWSATIEGIRPISKKNSRIITRSGASLPSKAYKKFNAAALVYLRGTQPNQPYEGDVTATIHIYMKGKLTADVDNFLNSWLDTLEDLGVYRNDDQVVDARLIKHRGAREWRSEIVVRSV
jgi:Holliday junction resolvase RusA-like endonuclease